MNRKLSVLIIFFLFSCTNSKKLDEAVFYEGQNFRLKLVRYYENLPFHYTGEVFRVLCSSEGTKNSPALPKQEKGWVTLGNGGAIGSNSATEIIERERKNYIVVDNNTLLWIGNGVNVSFDACGTFRGWYPTSLPENYIIPIQKPDYCKPKGNADCRHYDFMGEREPQFKDIRISAQGQIEFIVSSLAIRDSHEVQVKSTDFGQTWQTMLL